MKKHTKVYLDYFNYGIEDYMPCELCGSRAVDIHHIHARGMGSSKTKDDINNLMGLCRSCHIEYGDKKQHIEYLIEIHNGKIKK